MILQATRALQSGSQEYQGKQAAIKVYKILDGDEHTDIDLLQEEYDELAQPFFSEILFRKSVDPEGKFTPPINAIGAMVEGKFIPFRGQDLVDYKKWFNDLKKRSRPALIMDYVPLKQEYSSFFNLNNMIHGVVASSSVQQLLQYFFNISISNK